MVETTGDVGVDETTEGTGDIGGEGVDGVIRSTDEGTGSGRRSGRSGKVTWLVSQLILGLVRVSQV